MAAKAVIVKAAMPPEYYKVKGYEARKSVGFLLRRASKLITTRIESLFVKEDISFIQWVILMRLRENISTTAAELGENLCHDSGAITRIIDQMETRGLLARERSTTDRRVIELHLTVAGQTLAEQFLPRVVNLYNAIFNDFSKEDADKTVELLTRIIHKLEVV